MSAHQGRTLPGRSRGSSRLGSPFPRIETKAADAPGREGTRHRQQAVRTMAQVGITQQELKIYLPAKTDTSKTRSFLVSPPKALVLLCRAIVKFLDIVWTVFRPVLPEMFSSTYYAKFWAINN